MPYHDVECTKCGQVIKNYFASPWPDSLRHEDGGELQILWSVTSSHDAEAHPRERTVIWQNPRTGEISYPPRNDAPMPSRYVEHGYQRVEFTSARAVEKFEKRHGVTNEKLWYNSGNGV